MSTQQKMSNRVFIIGLDGARGSAASEAPTPHIDALLAKGVRTYSAKTVFPSSSFEAWGSMFHGVKPEKHMISNEHPCPENTPWPSFMKLVKQRYPGCNLASFVAWEPINSRIIELSCECYRVSMSDSKLVRAAANYIRAQDPKVFFMHLDLIDAAGHSHGYRSPEYLNQITETDAHVGIVLDAIRHAHMFDDSLIILLSDHGGYGYGHGSNHPDCMRIFWGCRGPGVAQGIELKSEVNIMDTAAVVMHALGLSVPNGWEAKVPSGVFST